MPRAWINVDGVESCRVGLVEATVLDVLPEALVHRCLNGLVIKSFLNGSTF